MPKPMTHLSRRDFIKLAGLSLLGVSLDSLLSGCTNTPAVENTSVPSATNLPTATATPLPPTATSTTTPEPSATPTPHLLTPQELRDQARLRLIEKYGVATKALPLEFHGDYYWMFDGAYSMNPETFQWMMGWFQENEVWSVTADELIGFIDGTLQIPARAVVLTTDSGSTSMDSLARMIPVLQQTGMHFISFIYTMQMLAEETAACPDNLCWQRFAEARDSGVFSFGSHTESHADFTTVERAWGLLDILKSKDEIELNLGLTPTLLSWPHEACPVWADELADYGFKAAFGGRSRPFDQCAVYANDELRWCLPRLFPPNRDNRLSGRPDGMTLEEMMQAYSDGFSS